VQGKAWGVPEIYMVVKSFNMSYLGDFSDRGGLYVFVQRAHIERMCTFLYRAYAGFYSFPISPGRNYFFGRFGKSAHIPDPGCGNAIKTPAMDVYFGLAQSHNACYTI
jgi:hypothetical protein